MPCAGPDYSCNSILTIRSPLGEVRIGAPGSSAPSTVWFLARTYLSVREWFAHRRQRRELSGLDRRMLDDIGVEKSDAAKESGKLF